MAKSKLDKEEKDILDSFNKEEWKSVKRSKRVKQLQSIADSTITKNLRVSINISKRDFDELQKKAIQEGIPYQTLISSILHKYVNGRLGER
jgi:predicted DNA binding CopG/RHH family protein